MPDRLEQLRGRIEANDRRIVEAMNERLRLVAEIKRVKAELGVEFVDPQRERELIARLEAANEGPLSAGGLHELYALVLELTKRELG